MKNFCIFAIMSLLAFSCRQKTTSLDSNGVESRKNHGDEILSNRKSDVQQAREYLENLDAFCYQQHGSDEANRIYVAMLTLLRSDDWKCFDDFLKSKNFVTVLYGLVGLYYTRPCEYADFVNEIRRRCLDATAKVTDFGDIDDGDTKESVAKLLVAGDGIRMYYGETIMEYCARQGVSLNAVKMDFQGGGIPVRFMDQGTNDLLRRVDDGNMPTVENIEFHVGSILQRKAEFYVIWESCFARGMLRDNRDDQLKSQTRPSR